MAGSCLLGFAIALGAAASSAETSSEASNSVAAPTAAVDPTANASATNTAPVPAPDRGYVHDAGVVVVSRAVYVEAGAAPTATEKARKSKPPPELPPVGCSHVAQTSTGSPLWPLLLLGWLRRIRSASAAKMGAAST